MSDPKTQGQIVTVTIFGQEYSIRGKGDEEHIRQVAAYVDERMNLIQDQTSITSPARLAILTALNIADELYTLRREKDRIFNEFEEKTRELSDALNQGMSEV